jgi:hypothetical protein
MNLNLLDAKLMVLAAAVILVIAIHRYHSFF